MPDIWMDGDTAVTVPCNIMPLVDNTDFKTVEDNTIAWNETGLEVYWNFVTTAGVMTTTQITPTTGGVYDWTHVDGGMYKIEIPASGGGSANNDTEGFGWITGVCTGGDTALPFRGPTIGFRASGLNDLLIDSAYSATRGLAGTALPNAAADAVGGLPISDAGGLDMDAILADTNEIQGKLPTNKIMGSSDVDNHDTDIDSILADTNEMQGKLPTNKIMGSSDVDNHDTDIDAILVDTNEMQGKLPTNNIMGSSVKTDQDDDIAAIKSDTAAILLDTGTDGVVVAAGSKTGYSLATDGISAASVSTAAVTKIGNGVRDTGGILASDATYTIGNALRDARAWFRGGWVRSGRNVSFYNDNGDGADPTAGTKLWTNYGGTAVRQGSI